MQFNQVNTRLRLIFVSVFLVTACAKNPKLFVQSSITEINRGIQSDPVIEQFIAPYNDSLSAEMNEVIGFAPFAIERNRPEGLLGNFVADLTLHKALKEGWVKYDDKPFVLMNHGGLRSPINQGEIKRGDVFKLMPFDNTIVVLRLDAKKLDAIYEYVKQTGGEPLSGIRIGSRGIENKSAYGESIIVITTDYLASGGDRMVFFQEPMSRVDYPVLLRDIIMEHIVEQDTIAAMLDERIKF
jgi:2',3'-cyclic-nucleotide 2'-phosphodiesterase (5'-nucleotidase family)